MSLGTPVIEHSKALQRFVFVGLQDKTGTHKATVNAAIHRKFLKALGRGRPTAIDPQEEMMLFTSNDPAYLSLFQRNKATVDPGSGVGGKKAKNKIK